jgi:hypothetical protein
MSQFGNCAFALLSLGGFGRVSDFCPALMPQAFYSHARFPGSQELGRRLEPANGYRLRCTFSFFGNPH